MTALYLSISRPANEDRPRAIPMGVALGWAYYRAAVEAASVYDGPYVYTPIDRKGFSGPGRAYGLYGPKPEPAHVLHTIRTLTEKRGYRPSYREVGRQLGIGTGAVAFHLRKAQADGLVDWTPRKGRALRLAEHGKGRARAGLVRKRAEPHASVNRNR